MKFTGSDDPVHPLIYGMSSELIVPEGHILLGDATAVIRRYPSSGKLITLRKSAAAVGLKIDGNKQTHYPHFKDLKKTDCAINMEGNCFVANCYVHSHPGTGIYTFGDFPYNLVYNCTCEDVGYIDLKYDARHYQGSYDQNSADGIYLRAFYNVALDCFVKDAFRWAYTTSHSQGGYCTYINCDAYNTLFKCYGFIDIEGADRESLIIDCDGGHESSLWQDYRNGFWISTNGTKALFCSANFFVSGDDLKKKRGDHITIIGCKTTGSGYGVWGDSPVVVKNLASKTHSCGTLRFDACCRDDDKTCASFYVNALDGTGIAAQNILYEQPDGPGMKIMNVRDIQNQCRFVE
ncbi:hypothetical protein GF337_13320 [candidate division KSB1 bacterium]|nr:hypothetical protein [candidate division KSB1 bacterium]